MESQPQNPEFKNNPENFNAFPCLQESLLCDSNTKKQFLCKFCKAK